MGGGRSPLNRKASVSAIEDTCRRATKAIDESRRLCAVLDRAVAASRKLQQWSVRLPARRY